MQSWNKTLKGAPTPEEIARELDIEAADIKQIINNTGHHVSMDAPISQDEDNNLYDIMLSKDSISPESELLRESLNKEVERILSTLTNREAEIIRLYYGLNGRNALTLEEIGEKFDLTRERVRQIKGKVIKVLKSRSKILQSYL